MAWATTRRITRRTALIVVLMMALSAVALGVWRPWIPAPMDAPILAAEEVVSIAPAPLALPEQPEVLVFGDSWTYGSAANEPTLGYAYVLADLIDGETTVDGVRGSGYLRAGIDGPDFGERIAALDPTLDPDLVIIQGSVNDRALGAKGYREAVTAAWDALTGTYPEAPIVVLGPAPRILPIEQGTLRIDNDLAALASARGWWYISPIQQEWISAYNYLDVIAVDPGNRHPSTNGHRYLAEKVAAVLTEMAVAPVTEAGGAEPDAGQ